MADAFTFDDDKTPDTIAAGSTIKVHVTGGCAPFTWNVAETGYSFAESETTGRINTLSCDPGTCGPAGDYEAVASLTITDACGTEIETEILNTSGDWSNCIYAASIGLYTDSPACSVNTVGPFYEGKALRLSYGQRGRARCAWGDQTWVFYAGDCTDYPYPPHGVFGWPDCQESECPGGTWQYGREECYVNQWECR
ncbi:MAG: hypothetical protein PVG39_23620 [Desulfobacteraceae bacterium]|jgi:hypothetical protein